VVQPSKERKTPYQEETAFQVAGVRRRDPSIPTKEYGKGKAFSAVLKEEDLSCVYQSEDVRVGR